MANVKLIYFRGCPNASAAREELKQAGCTFDEIQQDDLAQDHPMKAYSSPTILRGDEIIFGSAAKGGGCSVQIPSVTDLHSRLRDTETPKGAGWATQIGSVGSALTVGLCPVCIPAIGAFLAAMGLGFIVTESVLHPMLISFLGITVAGLAWSYWKEHRKIAPVVLGVAMAASLYIGRYVYVEGRINQILMYGGIIGIVGVSLWNMWLGKKSRCGACVPSTNRIDLNKQEAR